VDFPGSKGSCIIDAESRVYFKGAMSLNKAILVTSGTGFVGAHTCVARQKTLRVRSTREINN